MRPCNCRALTEEIGAAWMPGASVIGHGLIVPIDAIRRNARRLLRPCILQLCRIGFPGLRQETLGSLDLCRGPQGASHGGSEKPGKLEVGGASRDSTGLGALEEGLISSLGRNRRVPLISDSDP